MVWKYERAPDIIPKVICALCYLSFGLVGILYIVFNGKGSRDQFFRFNFLQAIILGMLNVLIGWMSQAFISILVGILGIFNFAATIVPGCMTGIAMVFGLSLKVMLLLNLYGLIFSLLGKVPEIPFISTLVRQQMRF